MFNYIVCYHYRYIFTENTVEPKTPVLKTKLILGLILGHHFCGKPVK